MYIASHRKSGIFHILNDVRWYSVEKWCFHSISCFLSRSLRRNEPTSITKYNVHFSTNTLLLIISSSRICWKRHPFLSLSPYLPFSAFIADPIYFSILFHIHIVYSLCCCCFCVCRLCRLLSCAFLLIKKPGESVWLATKNMLTTAAS